MKKLVILSCFILSCTVALAQKSVDTVYVSNNGTAFKVGQKLTLGLGTRSDGWFKYILSFDILGLPETNKPLPSEYATKQVIITKIKRQKARMFSKGDVTVYLMFKSFTNAGINFGINIEPALVANEIIVK
ncbi:hypothetical protein KXQ82_15415 [Mucilaginibacter sp. HMF5004]|uniref:hypothetical protein n=1 Tax=Mucilaginibacter rivuli TaxID=2857527 RepID=UPI001C5F6835|nr:hypothetical protein [Mucilaginibacter rivuli]MBW4891113.1 hypothetical protein [Mucilaginibacter rivuli]